MDWIGIITLFSSLATMVGVFVAGFQIKKTTDLHRIQFEDSLAKEYRDLIQNIPIKALLGEELNSEEFEIAKPYLFHYINLSNDQTFLYQKGRISDETWHDWEGGIKANMSLHAIRQMWEEIDKAELKKEEEKRSFQELRGIIKELKRLEAKN